MLNGKCEVAGANVPVFTRPIEVVKGSVESHVSLVPAKSGVHPRPAEKPEAEGTCPMNRSNMIESLEDRQLFSSTAFTSTTKPHSDGLSLVRATQPAIVGDLHQPLSYSFGANQTATGWMVGSFRG